jgi:ADP-ribose pyrophosphatase
MATTVTTHRQPLEYLGGVRRFPVPEDKIPWSVDYPGYHPVDYTAPRVLSRPVWADPDIRKEEPEKPMQFNSLDGKVDRRSHTGTYQIVDKVPRNPVGRTGMIGRGLLGRWGPNHAADPIVTRWKRDGSGARVEREEGKPVLEFVAVRRGDTGTWAIPGGMVEAGDTVSATLKKEFGEEALNSLEATDEEKRKIEEHINHLFKSGDKLYAGYVDDPRNTDNAWMETVVFNFHDDSGEGFSKLNLVAGDDAAAVAWTEVHSGLSLYASHSHFVRLAVEHRKAAW